MTDTLVVLRHQDGRQASVSPKAARLLSRSGWREQHGPAVPEWDPPGRGRWPLRILAHVHRYPPVHCAGAEMMLHSLLRHAVAGGCEAAVIVRDGGARKVSEHDGIELHPASTRIDRLYQWADVVLTHLDCTGDAMANASRAGRPIVHLVHNDAQLSFNRVRPESAHLVVFNSRWLEAAVPWPGRHVVVRPPVYAEEYRTTPGEALTLLNLTKAKGSGTFYALARRLPKRSFLGVRGAYGRQEVPKSPPRNVVLLEHTPDMLAVYGNTRILLAPSEYESWGRVVIEAAASGIPSIAHPTPGLRESLGSAGTFVDRDDIDGWAAAVKAFDDPDVYAGAAARALARSAELDPTPECERFEAALAATVAAGV